MKYKWFYLTIFFILGFLAGVILMLLVFQSFNQKNISFEIDEKVKVCDIWLNDSKDLSNYRYGIVISGFPCSDFGLNEAFNLKKEVGA